MNALTNLHILITFVISIMLASLGGCTKEYEPAKESKVMTHGEKYPFALDEVQLSTLVQKISQIHLGVTRQEVRAALGDPWEDLAYGPKETNRISGRFIKYYATKSSDLPNNHDQVVTFYFGADDHLVKISSNIPGIPSRP